MADDVIEGPLALPFTNVELTGAINQLPTPFGQFTQAGFFPAEPLATTYVEVDIVNGVLTALPVTGDGPATLARHDSAAAVIFKVPKIEHQDDVKAADIRGMYQIAAQTRARQPETLANLMNKRLQRLKNKFNLTWELMRTSAIKGLIIDGAGKTIYDLFAKFEITKKVVYFNFADPNADIVGACGLVYDLITQDLSDEVMTGIEVTASSSFFSALVSHPNVEKFYLQAQQALQLADMVRGQDGGYRPRTFNFQNITWKEYNAVIPMWGGGSQRIIAAGLAHAYPAGTIDTHVTYLAPHEDVRVLDGSDADVNDAIHITTEPMKHGKGVEMLGQMNALPLWRRPKLLVELHAEAGQSTVPIGS